MILNLVNQMLRMLKSHSHGQAFGLNTNFLLPKHLIYVTGRMPCCKNYRPLKLFSSVTRHTSYLAIFYNKPCDTGRKMYFTTTLNNRITHSFNHTWQFITTYVRMSIHQYVRIGAERHQLIQDLPYVPSLRRPREQFPVRKRPCAPFPEADRPLVADILNDPWISRDLEKRAATVMAEAWVEGPADDAEVTFTLAGQTQTVPVADGCARADFTIENVHLWDGLTDPYLYTAAASLSSGDAVSARFGCRKFEIDPQKGFLLNGRSYPLRGVSRHQDRKGAGNALTPAMMEEDMAIIKELGANTLRLAHYQHAQYFYDLCDENGLIVWAEIPYITMHMHDGRENTLSQMTELVVQNYNHPCIAVWGLSNEITAASAVNEELLENHRALNDLCHKLDTTRPTTMANVFMLDIDSPILEIPDVNSYNLYFGWYLGELEQNDEFFDEYHAKYPDRCIGFSEYGADANPAYQSPTPEKGDYTESYQCVYHEHILQMIEARPWLWATHVWNLFDFGADGRDEGGKNGENQKGLVTFDRQLKKDAFYLYKAAWNHTEPFVHLCGSRYVDRTEEVTEIKVYSNQNEVSLYLDGKLFATRQGHVVFSFQVPISGEHTIEARAEDCTSVMLVRKVSEPNPAYRKPGRAASTGVTNWFDKGEADPNCYSILDTLGEIRQNPEAAAIIDQMMAKGAESHGEIAETVKDNPALQRMMNRITLVSLLKQSGADEESIKQLNRILQGIKKPEVNV